MTELMDGIVFWHWWILAAVLMALEMFAPTTLFLWTGMAAGVIGLVVLFVPGMSWQIQVLAFAVLAVAAVVLWRRYMPARRPSDEPALNERARQYLGQIYALEAAIVNGSGRVNIGDSTWIVRGQDLPAGARVRVTGSDGSSLTVEPA